MEKEKIEMLVKILKDVTLQEWNKIKSEIDITYRDIEYKKVPNEGLGTLKENLIHKLEL